MSNNSGILNELKEISPLLLQIKENEKSLLIPPDYFLQLADNLLGEIKSESDLLASIKKEKTAVPENYFDTFGDTIISKIKEQIFKQTVLFPRCNNSYNFLSFPLIY